MKTLRLIGILCSVLALCASSAACALANPGTIANLNTNVPISAGQGWLLWSVPVAGGWGLDAYHHDQISPIPVAPRPQPFDVNVGTSAAGVAVATFSRCVRTPLPSEAWQFSGTDKSSGCRIYMLNLASGRESRLPIPAPHGVSDTTPSIWHGNVAFARKSPFHKEIEQVMLWSSRHPHTLTALRHGAVPSHCPERPRGCVGEPQRGSVVALDSNGKVVTYLWHVSGPGIVGEGTWEVRLDDLATGHSSIAATGFGREVCTGPTEGVENSYPGAPLATGDGLVFPLLQIYGYCYRKDVSSLVGLRYGSANPASGSLPGNVLAIARDGSSVYALTAQTPTAEMVPTCSSEQPCALEAITLPPLTKREPKPVPPFQEFFET
ncbi:MAG TPA: hypothetical protein VIH71_04205 [Solirubrobacteraceae bacterium]